MDLLKYDGGYMRITDADRASFRPKTEAAHDRVEAVRASGAQGWFDLPSTNVTDVLAEAKRLHKAFKRLVVVGIGGSDLGARALVQALGKPGAMEVSFVSSPDAHVLQPYLKASKDWWAGTALFAVSKSGGTVETLTAFFLLRKALMKAVGMKAHRAHVSLMSDPVPGNPLVAFAAQEAYAFLPHPVNVGGRFSVLSGVGLLPAACAGADVKRLLAGAKAMEDARRKEGAKHASMRYVADQFISMMGGRRIHVLMPYSQALEQVGRWYRQLWAESLGKNGQGPTPVAALGPVDQHSQMQLYVQGPEDKTVTFIEVADYGSELVVPAISGAPAFAWLSGLESGQILRAERRGSADALAAAGRPCSTITLANLEPESVGALLMFYEQSTVNLAALMGVDAYDQPGVEDGKRRAKALLTGRKV